MADPGQTSIMSSPPLRRSRPRVAGMQGCTGSPNGCGPPGGPRMEKTRPEDGGGHDFAMRSAIFGPAYPNVIPAYPNVIARLDRAIQYARSVFTGSPGRAGR